jgi:3-oxoadipate enol-lactonase
MPFVELDDILAHYEEEGEGPPVLLLHNYFGTLGSWDAQRKVLGERYRLVVTDARGHGRTTHPGGRLRLTDFAEDTAQLVRSLGIAPVHVVGSSLGAQVGLHLAREHPRLVRTLSAVGPPHLDEPSTRAYMDRTLQRLSAGETGHERPKRRTDEARSVLIHNFDLDRREIPGDQIASIQLAGAVTCPTLVVGGDDDPVFPVRRALELHDRIPESELLVLPRAGHLPHRTMPHVFNELMLGFLLRHA